MQARTRRLRSPPRIVQNSSNKARRRKLFSPRAMANLEENLLNAHRSTRRRVEASGERDRRCERIALPLGTSERKSFPSPQVKSLFCMLVPDIATARQSERIDLSAARAKAPRVRNSLRKNSTSSMITPSPHSLIVQPGSGTGGASPEGEAAQGPSPIDYNMEIEADFQQT
jgi:hypothetical protein